MKFIFLCLGGMAGTLLRYFVSGCTYKTFGANFPYGTFAVNILGCLLIGFLAGLSPGKGLRLTPEIEWFLVFGFLGAFTTFSTFGYDSFRLIQKAEFFKLFLNINANVGLGVLAVWAGAALGKGI